MSADEPRLFTTAEAEALLPEIDRLLGEAQKLLARFDELPLPPSRSAQSNGQVRSTPPNELEKIQHDVEAILERIQSQGVIVRELRTGLIDFPSVRDGQPIYLCWQRGEPLQLEWWHPTTTGIAGRQRL